MFLLAASVIGIAGAAAETPGARVAFTAGETFDRGDVVLADADGTNLSNLTPGQASPFDDDRGPTWSPDGLRLAFVSHRDANNTQEIYVMNADGGAPRRLTRDSGREGRFNVDPAWSPDGSLIAWRKVLDSGSDEIWVTSPDGTGQRALTNDAGRKSAPLWAPDSSRLLYVRAGRIVVVDRTGVRRALTPAGVLDSAPRWSPDGRRIAFGSQDRIWVMSADGGERRRVSDTHGLGPSWSPDGRRLAFTGLRSYPELATRLGIPVRNDVFVVDVDGSDERRLTGPLGPEYSSLPTSGAPTWWPDGRRVFFSSGRNSSEGGSTTYVMNADGTCERRFAPDAARLFSPVWRPGSAPGLPPLACAELRIQVAPASDATGLNQDLLFRVLVENDGNRIASGLRLRARIGGGARLRPTSIPGCREAALSGSGCELAALEPGRRVELGLAARSARVGPFSASFSVQATGADDGETTSNVAATSAVVLPCSRVGTMGNDALTGTDRGDTICARAGWDRINALGGNDRIDAGNGSDTVDAGKGRDTVSGKGGADVILVRDGERDTVDCGTEGDDVLADRLDAVARNCERVVRR